MKINELANIIESDFPLHYAFDGDNVGLLVGCGDTEITSVLATCDVDLPVVKEAIKKGSNLILSHHPLMFRPLKRLTEDNPEQKAIRLAVANGISIYSAHTNLDSGRGGINDLMALLAGLGETSIIDVSGGDEKSGYGFGRMGELEKPLKLYEFMDVIIEKFSADGLRYAGDKDKLVKLVAVNTGGGADVIPKCIELGCDVLVTGDIKYNGYRDAVEMGMCIVDIMHFDSEHIVKEWFEKYLSQKAPGLTVHKSAANVNLIKSYISQ